MSRILDTFDEEAAVAAQLLLFKRSDGPSARPARELALCVAGIGLTWPFGYFVATDKVTALAANERHQAMGSLL